jgi:uncharacterized protein YaiI (UPF0178 family)
MHIWVDADACPKPIKEILFRAATRTGIMVTLIANQMLTVPRSPHIRAVQVPKGFDVADNEITRRVAAGDLVITSDIPLAADVIAKGAKVLTPRGEPYDTGSVFRQRPAQLRKATGSEIGGAEGASLRRTGRLKSRLGVNGHSTQKTDQVFSVIVGIGAAAAGEFY